MLIGLLVTVGAAIDMNAGDIEGCKGRSKS
jgi:hypothetical protein